MRAPFSFIKSAGAGGSPPTLASVSTSSGYPVGDIDGTYSATLTGTGFTGATGVTFGGTAATSVVVVNSTTITCLVPAHATGVVSVVVTTAFGSNGANSAWQYFSPAELTTAGWWRANYSAPGADPRWSGTASAGGSGTQNLNLGPDSLPTTGTTQNGYTPATFSSGVGHDLISAANFTALATAGAGTIAILVYVVSAAAPGGGNFSDPAVWSDSTGSVFALMYNTSNFKIGLFDGVQKTQTVAGDPRSAYHLVIVRWDSTNARLRVDATDASVAAGAISGLGTNKLLLGKQPGVSFANMRVLDTSVYATSLPDLTCYNLRAYCSTRYNV